MKYPNRTMITDVVLTVLVAAGAASPAYSQTCALLEECGDVDSSGSVSSSDALKVLKKAVGQPQVMACSCGETEPPPPVCQAGGIKVSVSPEAPAPADIDGLYAEAFDCTESEGGNTFGGVDSTHCYRKADGSSWRLWNTGCGWQIGRVEGCDGWVDYARTYAGSCGAIPPEQLDERALTTDSYKNNFGDPIVGIQSGPCTP